MKTKTKTKQKQTKTNTLTISILVSISISISIYILLRTTLQTAKKYKMKTRNHLRLLPTFTTTDRIKETTYTYYHLRIPSTTRKRKQNNYVYLTYQTKINTLHTFDYTLPFSLPTTIATTKHTHLHPLSPKNKRKKPLHTFTHTPLFPLKSLH